MGLVFQFGYNIVAAILRSLGDSRATLYFLLISSVVNILLDLLFVAVFRWGVAGAAIAIEKCFQGGGDELRAQGIRVESLACIEAMTDTDIVFRR